MFKFIALSNNSDIYFLGETLDEAFDLAQEEDIKIDDLSFYNLGDKIEVELKVIPVVSQ